MDIKKIIKENVNRLLFNEVNVLSGDRDQNPDFLPSPAPISGDRAAQRVTQAKSSIDDVKERMRKWGVYDLPELGGINTLQQLEIEPFRFTFIVQVPEDQQSLDLPNHITLETVSRVRQVNPLILDFILESEQHGIPVNNNSNPYSVEFTHDDELTVNLPGTNRNIRALQSETNSKKGRFYHVRFNMPPFNINESNIIADDLILESKDKVCGGKIEVGQKVTFKSGKHAGNVFIVKKLKGVNDNMVNIQRESDNKRWAVECDKLIKYAKPLNKDDNNNNNEKPVKPNETFESRIYAKSVTLGPKAIKRRNADAMSYANRNNSGNGDDWDGNFTSLPVTPISYSRVDIRNANGIQQGPLSQLRTDLNSRNRTIRRSQQGNNNDFVIYVDNDEVLHGRIDPNDATSFNFIRGGNVTVLQNRRRSLPQFTCQIQITR